MPNVYVDTDDLKQSMGISNTDFADADIDEAVASASDMVDGICGRTFAVAGAEDETRYYLPQDATTLRIDDLVELTSVDVDRDNDGTYEETLTVGTDVRLGPPNAAAEGKPYTWIEGINGTRLDTTGGYVRVVGRFGWPAVPTAVVEATGILASRLVRRKREAPFAIVLDAAGGAARIGRNDPEVRGLLQRYIISASIGSPRLG